MIVDGSCWDHLNLIFIFLSAPTQQNQVPTVALHSRTAQIQNQEQAFISSVSHGSGSLMLLYLAIQRLLWKLMAFC